MSLVIYDGRAKGAARWREEGELTPKGGEEMGTRRAQNSSRTARSKEMCAYLRVIFEDLKPS